MATSAAQSFRGGNWGVLSVDDATKSIVLADPQAPGTHVFRLPKQSVKDVTATKADLVVHLADNASGLAEIKFAVPKDSAGLEGLTDAPRHVKQHASKALGLDATAAAELPASGAIGSFEQVQLVSPNAVFDIIIHTQALRFRDVKGGTTITILPESVQRLFLLPIPNAESQYLVIALKGPIAYGAGQLTCLVFAVPKASTISKENPWRPKDIKSQEHLDQLFPDREKCLIKLAMDGLTAEVLAAVFKTVTKAPLNSDNADVVSRNSMTSAVRAQFRGSEGWLYILKNLMLFLHRPATVIPYQGLTLVKAEPYGSTATVEFELVREGSRTKEKVILGGIEAKADFPLLLKYLDTKGIARPGGNGSDDGDDEEGDEESEDESYGGDDSDDGDDSADSDFDSEDGGKKRKKHREENKKEKKSKKEKKEKHSKKEKKDKKRDKKEKKDKHA